LSDRGRQGTDGAVSESNEPPHEGGDGGRPRYSRRLSDKVLIAFHHACDQDDFEVAEQLLLIMETMLSRRSDGRPGGNRRRKVESLVAAHERLWQLRHPEPRHD
jgi:hypothetical protein